MTLQSIRALTCPLFLVIASWLASPLASTLANAQEATDKASQYQIKVYNVADLIETPLQIEESSPPVTSRRQGGGLGGGGGMGGGGFFRIPDNILPQLGGGGMGGGGLGGGGMGGGMMNATSLPLPDRMTREALEDILLVHLDRPGIDWVDTAGEGGSLSIVGPLLIVTQTPPVHQLINGILEALRAGNRTSSAVQVDIRVVELAAGEKLPESSQLESIAADDSAARITLRCDNHRIAKISAGLRRSYVVSLTPVVGGNDELSSGGGAKMGYQPVTVSPLLGLFGKVKPEIDENKLAGKIHLAIELASGPEEVLTTTFGNGTTIDRLEIESARVETSVRSSANAWTLAGVVAVSDPSSNLTSGQALPHVAVLVRWQPAP